MGLFKKRDGPEKRGSQQLQDFIKGVDVDFVGTNSNSGIQVDELRALQTSAVYACVKILAEYRHHTDPTDRTFCSALWSESDRIHAEKQFFARSLRRAVACSEL